MALLRAQYISTMPAYKAAQMRFYISPSTVQTQQLYRLPKKRISFKSGKYWVLGAFLECQHQVIE
jgi:hypothetical protein